MADVWTWCDCCDRRVPTPLTRISGGQFCIQCRLCRDANHPKRFDEKVACSCGTTRSFLDIQMGDLTAHLSRAVPAPSETPPTTGESLSIAETERLLGSDRPISIGKVPTDPLGMRAIASIVRERTATPPNCGLSANDIYHVMQAWERMPASDEQTRIVIALGKLRDDFIKRGDSANVTTWPAPGTETP